MQVNAIYCGDCLQVLNDLEKGSVDLIYVDPPFGSGQNYEIVFKDGVEVRHFKDRWIGGKQSYLDWMAPRIRAIHQVLNTRGSFYLHCDWHLNAHLRVLCDSIFHESNFRNEIVWKRTFAHSGEGVIKKYGVQHDTILFYTKSDDYTFNPTHTSLSDEYKTKFFRHSDGKGLFQPIILTGAGIRHGETGEPWKGVDPTKIGRHWAVPPSKLDELDKQGMIWFPKKAGGTPRLKRYLKQAEAQGKLLQDIWDDIRRLQPYSEERLGYPTQKPIPLLQRIIAVSSNAGDLVLDPMCGCGTTLIAAQTLRDEDGEPTPRRWIGIDISPTSCKLMAKGLRSKGVDITEDDIIGLPRSVKEIRRMIQLDAIEFQNWVCDRLNAVSTTPRGKKPHADWNVDGWIMNMIPIQVKGSEGIGYDEIERFQKTLENLHVKEGYYVAFSFSKPAYEYAFQAKSQGIAIDLLELEERRVENPRFPRRPEIYTVLKSDITRRIWGEHHGAVNEPSIRS